MGWGAKKVVAALQPITTAGGLAGNEPIPEDDESFRLKIVDSVERVEPTQAHKDFVANGNLMARWAPETRHILVMEFIKQAGLFDKLNAFLKRKIR